MSKVTSRKSTLVRPVATVICRSNCSKNFRSFCLSFSSFWALSLLWCPSPSSLYRAKLISGNVSLIFSSSIRPTRSVTWAPSYEPIVTSKSPVDFIHTSSSWYRTDRRAWFIRSFSRGVMLVTVSANSIAFFRRVSVTDG